MRKLLIVLSIFFTSSVLHGQSENYYAPFHYRTKDSTQITVSKFGHYVSFGIGSASDNKIGGEYVRVCYSLAYKSHILSLTHVGYGIFSYGGGDRQPYVGGNYNGILLGESIRAKNVFFALSAGIANSITDVKYRSSDATIGYAGMTSFYRQGISFPIELKLFILARNGVGFGLDISKNMISPANFSPFFVGVSIVFGRWNKERVKK